MTLEVARSIREDFLHQNAFHETDTYTSLGKQAQMLAAILHFHQATTKALEAGADVSSIETLPVRERIARMKYLPEEETSNVITSAREEIDQETKNLGGR